MKRIATLLLGAFCLHASLFAQVAPVPKEMQNFLDSLDHAWKWQTGNVTLGDNLATINVPTGWRYLPSEQAEYVLTLWGNPPSPSLGMLFPATVGPLDSAGILAFDLSWDEMGYVKDGDADDIDYADLLKDLQKDAEEGSKQRLEQGYDAVKIIGWASTPYYDKEHKVLHWAKEIQFGEAGGDHTLNYDVRVLGRKGVLSMNAIGGMEQLDVVKAGIPGIIGGVAFAEGQRYADFDSNVDDVAAWTIGGLVAGKVLAKAGFFAIVLKFIKPILLVLAAVGGGIWRFVTGRRKEEEDVFAEYAPKAPDEPGDAPKA